MNFLMYTFFFTGLHLFSYVAAGTVSLKISGELYRGNNRLLDFLRDMSDEEESTHVHRYFLLAQIPRGILMSIVLYPVISYLGGIAIWQRFLFYSGLMFLYTDFASAVPFPHNIEGFVYMKEKFNNRELTWKLYFETAVYSIIFGIMASRVLT